MIKACDKKKKRIKVSFVFFTFTNQKENHKENHKEIIKKIIKIINNYDQMTVMLYIIRIRKGQENKNMVYHMISFSYLGQIRNRKYIKRKYTKIK